MRIISALALALLLVTGVAVASHAEEAGAAPAPVAAAVDTAATASQVEAGTAPVLPDGAIGSALCLLGALCGLVIALLVRRARHRRPAPTTARRSASFALPIPRGPSPRATGPTLAQLGLSRT